MTEEVLDVKEPVELFASAAKPNDPVEAEQERFNRFIQAENERLNRLIRNLYLHFQLEHYSERDLYDHICQEVAKYFRAASCELYIVRYDEESSDIQEERKGTVPHTQNDGDKGRHITKWLELVGAFGPARRALKQQYVTQRSRSRYEIPIDDSDRAAITGVTRRAFTCGGPTRYTSGYDLRSVRADSPKQQSPGAKELRTDSSRQVVWYQDGLYNSYRCGLMVPLVRERRDSANNGSVPLYCKIGLIKLENRTPYGVGGFLDVSAAGESSQDRLFFLWEWRIAALRPYVRDLQQAAEKEHDPFLPLHNNVGWWQYFEDHSLGVDYFQQLLRELHRQGESPDHETVEHELLSKYKELARWLEELVECLIQLESWLQHLQYACRLMLGAGEMPSLERPTPSLFNVYNLRGAYLERPKTDTKDDVNNKERRNGQRNRHVYDALYGALLDCLVGKDEKAKRMLLAGADVLSAVDRAEYLAQNLSYPPGENDLKQMSQEQRRVLDRLADFKNSLEQERDLQTLSARLESLCRDFKLQDLTTVPRTPEKWHEAVRNIIASLDRVQQPVKQGIEELTQSLCEKRVKGLRQKLGITAEDGHDFEEQLVEQALQGKLPPWNFKEGLKEVLSGLASMSQVLAGNELEERVDTSEYALISEETGVLRIGRTVQSILKSDSSDESRDALAFTASKVAQALADATMYTASFAQIDEKRLLFIASHVVKVLDNHMLHQARQRQLELDYDALGLLGMEHFGLELLDSLYAYTHRVTSALCYLLEREMRLSGPGRYRLDVKLFRLRDLVGEIDQFTKDAKQEEWLEHCLATIDLPSLETGEHVLQQIHYYAAPLGIQARLALGSAQCPHPVLFLPCKSFDPDGERPLAEVLLRLNGTSKNMPAAADCLELRVHFEGKALQVRNLGVFWQAVRALKGTLEAIGAIAGRHYATTSTG